MGKEHIHITVYFRAILFPKILTGLNKQCPSKAYPETIIRRGKSKLSQQNWSRIDNHHVP